MRKALKLIGWLCLFCVVIIGGWFTIKILVPSLTAIHASKPYLTLHVKQWTNFQAIAFSPDGEQFFYLNRPDKKKEIQRWDISTGKELPSIRSKTQEQNIYKLSDDGQYYVAYDSINRRSSNYNLYRTSDQSLVAALPKDSKGRTLDKIIGGDHPFAAYFEDKGYVEYYPRPDDKSYVIKRRFYIWDFLAQRYLSTNPPTTTLYNYPFATTGQVTYAHDGTKVLSLWPVYTRKNDGKTVTAHFTHWIQTLPGKPPIFMNPKEVHLLNESNGKIITLPFPKEYIDLPSFKQGQYLTKVDEKYFLDFDFGWINPASSPNQNLFAAVADHKWFENGEIWCYDLPNRSLKWRYYRTGFSPSRLQFSPDNKLLAAGGGSTGNTTGNPARLDQLNGTGILSVLDANTGRLLYGFTEQTLWQQIRDRTQMEIGRLKHLPKSDKDARGTHDTLRNPVPPVDLSEEVGLIAWSPDSSLLAAAYIDGSVKIWRVK